MLARELSILLSSSGFQQEQNVRSTLCLSSHIVLTLSQILVHPNISMMTRVFLWVNLSNVMVQRLEGLVVLSQQRVLGQFSSHLLMTNTGPIISSFIILYMFQLLLLISSALIDGHKKVISKRAQIKELSSIILVMNLFLFGIK